MKNVARTVALFLLVFHLFPCGIPGGGSAVSASTAAPDFAPLACSAERPIAWRGETISIHAWLAPSGDAAPTPQTYEWTASGGQIVGAAVATWRLDGDPGPNSAMVRVGDPRGASLQCSIRVIVKEQPDRDANPLPRETGRSVLVRGQTEEKGYGLYSYLLLGSPPDEDTRERYLQVLSAYWEIVPTIADLEAILPRDTLNVTYLPATTAPASKASAEWALDHYDYARALALLRTLSGNHRRGPYLVSSPQPIVTTTPLSGYLFLDLSTIPPRLAGEWMKDFLNQAAQCTMSKPCSGASLALELRTILFVAASGLQPVLQGVDQLIVWRPKIE